MNFLEIKKSEKKIIGSVTPLAEKITQLIKNINTILRSIFCSYFLISLISFWNISLLFNFINVPAVPVFAGNFLEMLCLIMYKQNTLLDWIAEVFRLKEGFFDFESEEIPEKMTQIEFGRAWFGEMGLSTNILTNNIEPSIIFGFLALKLVLLTLILKCFKE